MSTPTTASNGSGSGSPSQSSGSSGMQNTPLSGTRTVYYTSISYSYSPIGGSTPISVTNISTSSQSGAISSSASGIGQGSGPGPVSGSNSGIVSETLGTTSGSMMTGSTSMGSMTGSAAPGGPSQSSGSNSGSGSAGTSSASPPASSGPACPDYDGQQFTDALGGTYTVHCDSTISGDVIGTRNSTSTKQKRQSGQMSVRTCMNYCDELEECVAVSLDCNHVCTLLGSVSGRLTGQCGTAARKISGPPSSGNGNVVTVTVCAAKARTTTVLTTATKTTCPAAAKCTWKRGLPSSRYHGE